MYVLGVQQDHKKERRIIHVSEVLHCGADCIHCPSVVCQAVDVQNKL